MALFQPKPATFLIRKEGLDPKPPSIQISGCPGIFKACNHSNRFFVTNVPNSDTCEWSPAFATKTNALPYHQPTWLQLPLFKRVPFFTKRCEVLAILGRTHHPLPAVMANG